MASWPKRDILEEFGEGGLYTKYILGEIHADFLDMDDEEDIATTSRQKLIEEDPRCQALKTKLRYELKYVQGQWTDLRRSQGTKQALALPEIKQWFTELDPDQKVAARRLFGRINEITAGNAGAPVQASLAARPLLGESDPHRAHGKKHGKTLSTRCAMR